MGGLLPIFVQHVPPVLLTVLSPIIAMGAANTPASRTYTVEVWR